MWTIMAILLAFYVGFFTASALAGSKRRLERTSGRRLAGGAAIYAASKSKVHQGIESAMTQSSATVQASRN